MSFRDWLKAGTLSTMLGFAAAQGANAQQAETAVEQDTTIVDPAQEIDYSKIEIDRVQISYNGTPLQDNLASFLTRGMELNDAEDAYNLNIKLQRMLEGSDPTLQRIIKGHTRGNNSTSEDGHNISVQAYSGETEYNFDAQDVPKSESDLKDEAKPPETERPARRTRGRGRGNNDPQIEP